MSKKQEKIIYLSYAYLQLYLILEKFLDEIIHRGDNTYYLKLPNGEKTDIARYKIEYEGNKEVYCFQYPIKLCGKSFKKEEYMHNETSPFLVTNYRMSAALIFAYGNNSSDVKKWPQIVYNRNQKAKVHAGGSVEGKLVDEDFDDIVDFMNYILNLNNISEYSPQKKTPTEECYDAEIVLLGYLKQAKLLKDGRIYQIEIPEKIRLKKGDMVIVTAEKKGGNIKRIIYKSKKD